MRRRYRWAAIGAVCLMFIFFTGMRLHKINIAFYDKQIQYGALSEEQELAFGQVEEIVRQLEQEEEPNIPFVAWSEKPQESISAFDGVRQADTTVLSLFGSSEYLFPAGRILHREDGQGCMIGEKTAEKLFGDRNVRGLTLSYQGREFIIRDILTQPEDVLVIQEWGEETAFSRITFWRGAEDILTRSDIETFCNRYGIGMSFLRQPGIPSVEELLELVPGKWSDFPGWKRNIKQWKEEQARMKQISGSVLDTV